MKKLFILLLALGVSIHFLYYLSAYATHWLDLWFEHVTMGQDFFQIPNGAFAFWRGGSLGGDGYKPKYSDCCGVNPNVYHPLFTLLVGTPLSLVPPWIAFSVWGVMHAVVTLITVMFVWRKFRDHSHVFLALAFFLLNSYHYYEIQHAQYHFLFNFFTLLFLYEAAVRGDTFRGGMWLFLSLLVKPIGLLWVIPLMLYRRFRVVFVGMSFYVAATVPFVIFPFGRYYLENFTGAASRLAPNYNMMALVNVLPLSLELFRPLSVVTAGILILYQVIRKPPLFSVIFLWIVFQLFFYSAVFHYHYTVIATLIALGMLWNHFSLRRFEFLPIVMLTIPTPIIFFHLTGSPAILPTKELSIIALWSVFWLAVLSFCLVRSDEINRTLHTNKT